MDIWCEIVTQKRDLDGLSEVLSKATLPADVPKTVIFCRTKNDTSKVYSFLLKSAYSKHSVGMYHSSLTQRTKTHVQDNFRAGCSLRCLSAKVAFGMVNLPKLLYNAMMVFNAVGN